VLWPDSTVTSATATAALCIALAVGCVFSAIVLHEPINGSELNRWHEAGALFCIALLAYFIF
jgi:hypothetical protein